MCTVTWVSGSTGYDLFFNRDELLTRQPALPPTVTEQDGLSFAAPTDADAGGTWIAANSAGVTVCLLNGYLATDRAPTACISRGLLVQDLATSTTCSEALERVQAAQLRHYRSFSLMIIDLAASPVLATWDGRELTVRSLEAGDRPLSSSSVDSSGAADDRHRAWNALVRETGEPGVADLEAFHRAHSPEPGARSVCMHREDAHTVSMTHVSVSEDSVQLRYCPGSPCANEPFETVRMRRLALTTSGDPPRG